MTPKNAYLLAAMVAAAQVAHAQQAKLPPVRPLGAVEHKSTELLGAVSTARALPGRRVLVNDLSGRKVVLFDSTLATFTVVADTTSATANAYSSRVGGLLPYNGDSTLFIDPQSLSMLVIDPAGNVTRVMSVPRPNDAGMLTGGPNGSAGFDAGGRMVYRAPPNFRFQRPAPGAPMTPPEIPDSAALIRVELATRGVDTVGFLKTTKQRMNATQDANGRMTVTATIHPLQVVDDWAVLQDGSIAIVRGIDYHIDWVRPDGRRESTAKVPFQWKRLSDSDKVAYIDSVKAAMEKLRSEAMARASRGGTPTGPIIGVPDGAGAAMGAGMIVEFKREEGGRQQGAPNRGREAGPGGPGDGVRTNIQIPPLQFVDPSELPDYAPPFSAGAARGDRDGNLWVRTSFAVGGGPVYDVINSAGELIDRVQIPANRVIAGFGPGGVVYMGVRDGAGVRLEQARRTALEVRTTSRE